MKRQQPSGAENRAKKAREEDQKKQEGAFLKFLMPAQAFSQPSTPVIPAAECTLPPKTDGYTPDDEVKFDNVRNDESNLQEKDDVCAVVETEEQCIKSSEHASRIDNEEVGPPVNAHQRVNRIGCELNDIADWPTVITDDVRTKLVSEGSETVQHMDGQFKEVFRHQESAKGKARKLTKDWFFRRMPNGEKVLRKWMCYSPKKESLFCFPCILFSPRSGSGSAFKSSDGFNEWWRLSPKIVKHETSSAHIQSSLAWRELEVRLREETTVDKKTQDLLKQEQQRWREYLKRILDIIMFLSKQNLAFRGHREGGESELEGENQGNFLELVKLLSKYDPVLMEHMLRTKLDSRPTTYMSPDIQNEFIILLGDHVRKEIIHQVKQAKYFSIIFDSTPDISRLDQTSQVLRYVVIDGDKVQVRESFIDFIDTKDKHAAEIADMILEKLRSDGLDIMDCRGQGYDNAAVMKGQHSGVQKRILEVNPKAQFIACSNHSLNLAGIRAAEVEVNSVTFFGTLDHLHTFFPLQHTAGTSSSKQPKLA